MFKKRTFFVLSLSAFAMMLGMGIIAPLMPLYAKNMGASGIWLGIIFSSYSLSRLVFVPLMGKASDKRGRKKIIAKIQGNARNILEAERTALNFLSHLSGIATLTNQFAKRVKGYNVKITDTRKTTPNLRYLEKYAVRVGGGYNHRKGLYDRILIKDNHIATVRKSPAECVLIAKRKTKRLIEVEVKKISQFRDTLSAEADTIMLDNMSLDDIKKAIKIKKDYLRKNKNKKAPQIEVSGNVKLSNVRKIAGCAVDLISIGALTHSNPSLDMALKVR